MLFLHEKGYTFFNIPNLTYEEINSLVDSMNRRSKRENEEYKKMERKSKLTKGGKRISPGMEKFEGNYAGSNLVTQWQGQ